MRQKILLQYQVDLTSMKLKNDLSKKKIDSKSWSLLDKVAEITPQEVYIRDHLLHWTKIKHGQTFYGTKFYLRYTREPDNILTVIGKENVGFADHTFFRSGPLWRLLAGKLYSLVFRQG